jgi:AAA+ superfamily predicted ATPase
MVLTPERHKEVIDIVQKAVDKSGKDLSTKLLKTLDLKKVIKNPKEMRRKFLLEALKMSAKQFNVVGKIGVDFGREKIAV